MNKTFEILHIANPTSPWIFSYPEIAQIRKTDDGVMIIYNPETHGVYLVLLMTNVIYIREVWREE